MFPSHKTSKYNTVSPRNNPTSSIVSPIVVFPTDHLSKVGIKKRYLAGLSIRSRINVTINGAGVDRLYDTLLLYTIFINEAVETESSSELA
jgi:hypothetical protein